MEDVWKELWSSSKVLGNYFLSFPDTVKGKYCLELGSGCGCLPSIAALKLGAASVIITDKVSKDTEEIQKQQHENLNNNLIQEEKNKIKVMVRLDVVFCWGSWSLKWSRLFLTFYFQALDWRDPKTTISILKDINHLDLIFGSDIFYDPEVFMFIINTVRIILNKFPNAEFIFAYEDRKYVFIFNFF